MNLRLQNCTLPGFRVSMRGSMGLWQQELGRESELGRKKKELSARRDLGELASP